jgi:GNAT superfamily N-acetyltransferase
MMTITRATLADLPALLTLVRDFYRHEHLLFRPEVETAVAQLVADESLGGAFLVSSGGGVVAYFILTFGFSVERGGKTALLDELYVIPESRGKSLGKAALAHAAALAKAAGCHTLHLEVDHINEKARTFYQRAGFIELPRGYLTLHL